METKSVKTFLVVFSFFAAFVANASLPGAVELSSSPANLSDAELAPLLNPLAQNSDVIAIGESVHGSAGFIEMQARMIRFFVEKHGLRLITWENPSIRSLELSAWVDSCRTRKSAPPIDVLYQPIHTDVPFFEWICEFNFNNASDPIVWRGMDIWDRGWEHFDRIESADRSIGLNAQLISSIFMDCPLSRLRNWNDINAVLRQVRVDKQFLPADGFLRCMNGLQSVRSEARLIAALEKSKTPRFIDALNVAISASTLEG